MKHARRAVTLFAIIFALSLAVPQQADAQWGIGASYEIRQEDPTNGVGVRIDRSLLGDASMLDISMRAHFSYFSEEIENPRDSFRYPGEITHYDFGLAGVAGVNIGFLTPYAGLGLGATTFDLEYDDVPSGGNDNSGKETKVNWNYFVGAEVSPIPFIHPFIEYRFFNVDEPGFTNPESGRMIFGVAISF